MKNINHHTFSFPRAVKLDAPPAAGVVAMGGAGGMGVSDGVGVAVERVVGGEVLAAVMLVSFEGVEEGVVGVVGDEDWAVEVGLGGAEESVVGVEVGVESVEIRVDEDVDDDVDDVLERSDDEVDAAGTPDVGDRVDVADVSVVGLDAESCDDDDGTPKD